DDGEREDRTRPHGVNVGQRVGRGDAPEIVRVVYDRHEKIGGGDHRLLVVQTIHGGIVAGLDTHEQLRIKVLARDFGEDFRKWGGRDFAAAPTAGCQTGQSNI